MIFSKIESEEGVQNFDEILAVSDGISLCVSVYILVHVSNGNLSVCVCLSLSLLLSLSIV